jgi:hypothetical protein
MRLMFVAAIAALGPDGCSSHPSPAPSIHPLVVEEAACEPLIIGGWVRDTVVSKPAVWVLTPNVDPTDSTCSLDLAVTDNAVASLLLDSARMALFADDSATRVRLKANRSARRQHARDTLLISQSFDDSIHIWEVRTKRVEQHLLFDVAGYLSDERAGLLNGSGITVHWLWQARLEADRLTLLPLSQGWLWVAIDSGRVVIAHERTDGGGVLLTAGSADLQGLLLRFADDTAAFPAAGAIKLRRWR